MLRQERNLAQQKEGSYVALLQTPGRAPQSYPNPFLQDLPPGIRFSTKQKVVVGTWTVEVSAPSGVSLLIMLIPAFSLEWNVGKTEAVLQEAKEKRK